jgi:hypothetical protein
MKNSQTDKKYHFPKYPEKSLQVCECPVNLMLGPVIHTPLLDHFDFEILILHLKWEFINTHKKDCNCKSCYIFIGNS